MAEPLQFPVPIYHAACGGLLIWTRQQFDPTGPIPPVEDFLWPDGREVTPADTIECTCPRPTIRSWGELTIGIRQWRGAKELRVCEGL